MGKRSLVIVLDSVGCGHAPDAGAYGDAGANTLGHLYQKVDGFRLPNLESLGLSCLLGNDRSENTLPGSSAYRLTETSEGKDTTTGHWELMGFPVTEPFPTFDRFPEDLVAELEKVGRTEFIGNKVASGTEILTELGEEHVRTGRPILYTSADSVLQIAAHEEVFGLNRLQRLCQSAREILDRRGLKIGRVIARPFLGGDSRDFRRTGNRHDYSLIPGETVLNRLQENGVKVIGVGKIADIFAGSGICQSHPTTGNEGGMVEIDRLWESQWESPHFIFANLVDFDSLYGHRRDPAGYAACLRNFDQWLGGFLGKINDTDLVIITADHGNDPYHPGTDHTREQVPCLVIGKDRVSGMDPKFFSDVGALVESYFARLPAPGGGRVEARMDADGRW